MPARIIFRSHPIVFFFSLSVCALWNAHCAVLHPEMRPVTAYLDETIAPEDDTTAVLVSPLAVVIGTVTLSVDGLVLNPILNLKPAHELAFEFALEDTGELGWAETVAFPMRLITYSLLLIGGDIFMCSIPAPWY